MFTARGDCSEGLNPGSAETARIGFTSSKSAAVKTAPRGEAGEVYEFEIDLLATANVFKAGHKIRVQVTSSEYPMFGRNLDTGGVNAAETVGVVAHNTIFHDAARPSHILLPISLGAPRERRFMTNG